jgi:hypothetical protein
MKNVCVIYDEDEQYGRHLMHALNSRKNLPFVILLYTKEDELLSYLSNNRPYMILAGERQYAALSNGCADFVVMLSEDEQDKTAGSIYKYQSVECIIREIIGFGGSSECGQKELELIGVYSPAGARYQTQFALNLSGVLAQRGKTLYINLEEYSGLDELLVMQNGYNLSDVLYYYRQSKGRVTEQMKEAVCSRAGIDYLAPAACPEDITYVGEEQIAEMARSLGSACGYQNIVLDISSFVKEQWRIIYYCDCIYMPVEENYLMRRKQINFDTYLVNSRAEEIAGRIKKINLPRQTAELTADYFDREDGEMKQYVRGVL